jgi:hypothetical protein
LAEGKSRTMRDLRPNEEEKEKEKKMEERLLVFSSLR